ncbi:MAG: hypothetical protein ACRCUY_06460 [Thermoguttaceae bacterium]
MRHCRDFFPAQTANKFCDFDAIVKIKAGKEVRSTELTVYFSHCASVREKNSNRSIKAGKEVRSTALTVYFSHRGTEDTEKRKKILHEPCASV